MNDLDTLSMLLSALYTMMSSLAFFWFMDAFAVRRYSGVAFAAYWAAVSALNMIAIPLFHEPQLAHIVSSLLLFILAAWFLYPSLRKRYTVLLTIIFYIASYALDFSTAALFSAMLGIDLPSFHQTVVPVIVRGIILHTLILCLCGAIKRISWPVKYKQLHWESVVLALLFPLSSLVVLLALFQTAFRKEYQGWPLVFCTFFLAVANFALLFLLNRLEKSEQTRQKQLAQEQMLQLQGKNIDALCAAYSQQRKLTHDYHYTLSTLHGLLKAKEWSAAQSFLESVENNQTAHSPLVNSRHPILDTVLNQKAHEAQNYGIDIHIEVNDLSQLALDPVDISTMFANLLDNAIEACAAYPGEKRLVVRVVLEEVLFFSIQNTCNPVTIQNNCIATTKPNPHLHGFGLENVKMILKKYHGEFSMKYENDSFLFVGEIVNTPLS